MSACNYRARIVKNITCPKRPRSNVMVMTELFCEISYPTDRSAAAPPLRSSLA